MGNKHPVILTILFIFPKGSEKHAIKEKIKNVNFCVRRMERVILSSCDAYSFIMTFRCSPGLQMLNIFVFLLLDCKPLSGAR